MAKHKLPDPHLAAARMAISAANPMVSNLSLGRLRPLDIASPYLQSLPQMVVTNTGIIRPSAAATNVSLIVSWPCNLM